EIPAPPPQALCQKRRRKNNGYGGGFLGVAKTAAKRKPQFLGAADFYPFRKNGIKKIRFWGENLAGKFVFSIPAATEKLPNGKI
ncbi:MAG: hypothetical protein HAW59_01300, partial [Betaproteobacteria bacterium]|nr:hypothetical protein [Betaproteobacteria bacterium]